MGTYDVMQVCENGHRITAAYNRYPDERQSACDKCGASTIHKCPNPDCGEPIRGKLFAEGVLSTYQPDPPYFCEECGESYPWTTVAEKLGKDIQQALTEGESEIVEFKRELPDSLRTIPKEVVALANHQGGSLFIGVTDDGAISGLPDIDTTEERVTGVVSSNIEPKIRANIVKFSIEQKDVLAIHVPRAVEKPYNVDGTFYIRTGTSVEKMSSNDLAKWFN